MKPSLSASALKVLALFTMLLDHMAYYLYLPEPLRWVGSCLLYTSRCV